MSYSVQPDTKPCLPCGTAGLGPSACQVWRVGLMGYNATAANVELVLTGVRQGLAEQGFQ